jgi:hypothetical protein
VLKLGIAAAWFTALASAATSVPEDEVPVLAAAPDALVPAEPPGAEDELDEQAASSSAAPAESTPSATRAVRGNRLLVLKRSMRPRIICIQGQLDHSDHRL